MLNYDMISRTHYNIFSDDAQEASKHPVCVLSDRDGSRHHCPPQSPTAQLNETSEVCRKTVLFIFGGMRS